MLVFLESVRYKCIKRIDTHSGLQNQMYNIFYIMLQLQKLLVLDALQCSAYNFAPTFFYKHDHNYPECLITCQGKGYYVAASSHC